jgi:hypothetical protein
LLFDKIYIFQDNKLFKLNKNTIDMKKEILILPIFLLLIISSLSIISAKTIVAGKIYDSPNFETANAVANANINVTCDDNLLTAISLNDGTYSVAFDSCMSDLKALQTSNDLLCCDDGSIVTVWAEKDGVSNSGTGEVHGYTAIVPDLYLGVVNIALVPEFGLFIGALTIMGAVGVFFFVRRQ